MIALVGNLHFFELLVIAGGALLVFGKRLPEVVMRGLAQVMRLRRSVTRMWREAGLEEELRRVKREIEMENPILPSTKEVERQAHWRARIRSDLEKLDIPESPSEQREPRPGHPEDHDPREPGTPEPPGGEEQDLDFHEGPDPEPRFPEPKLGASEVGAGEAADEGNEEAGGEETDTNKESA